MPTPPREALAAILAGQTRITRRCEIYESDGTTPWNPGFTPRMITGSVGVDYTRDERRSIDLTLDNSDGLIVHNPKGGLWYDKVIKVYRGVQYSNARTEPSVAVIQNSSTDLSMLLLSLGFTNMAIFRDTVSISDLANFDILVVGYEGTSDISSNAASLAASAYAAGISVLTISPFATPTTVPLIGGLASLGSLTATSRWDILTPAASSPIGEFTPYQVNTTGNPPYTLPSSAATNVFIAANSDLYNHSTTHTGYGMLYEVSAANTARWVHYHAPIADVKPAGVSTLIYNAWRYSRNVLISSAMDWLYAFDSELSWEVQIGEFLIDKITVPRFPHNIQITGRDFTKKLMLTKFDNALSFSPGTSVDTLVTAIATFGNIYKTRLNSQGAVTDSTLSFDGTTTLWDAIKGICESQNIEVFFDAQGYLVTRPFFDPSTSPTTLTLKTGGTDGNLVDWTETSDDSELYNRIVVSGTSQDSSITGNVYQAISENHEPSSPTSIENLNQVRTYSYSSSFFTSNDQCQAYADSLLSYHALESFDLSYSSIVFAWLEAGEIVEILLPSTDPGTPTRFLNTAFSIPLSLDAMTGTAKRITIVGS